MFKNLTRIIIVAKKIQKKQKISFINALKKVKNVLNG